ncbi:uncharacterized protein JN550_000925 [Neoarthrinium moseri]|uniref:uncharacterized protein n=1 Tax=Neoarthrinium moseri TaxID=1658444 RepID=UPI001FDC2A32|nr:uncharacterized protein JN550_000925 [Neoarthrinium moseri]KAI1876853.1 hypothetical protein JN550_000925 [Neoarthrinium moseri]
MAGFEFVNVTDPKEVKKHSSKIRRHVMKDIGKARRKPKPRDRRQTKIIDEQPKIGEEDDSRPADRAEDEVEKDLRSYIHKMTTAGVRNDGHISQMVYPFEMTEDRIQLARYMIEEARHVYRPFRFAWLSVGLTDAASWNITLANAALFRSRGLGAEVTEYTESQEALKYYTLSLESISKRLQDPEEVGSEGLVIAVTGFICHDNSVGNFERMNDHLKGLKHIVEKRGGLEKLSSPFLRLMISWHDLCAATYLNASPYFKVPEGSLTEIDTGDDTMYLDVLLRDWDFQCPSLGDIMCALKATAKVAIYVNRHGHEPNFWKDDVTIARLLGPASHEILTLEGRPLPSDSADPEYSGIAAREAFRRAALIFLADVKIRCLAGARELPRHLDAFRQISRLPLVNWTVVPELNLWAHVVAAIQEDSDERAWHVAVISGIMDALGLETGSQALDVARGVIWAESIMGEKAQALSDHIDSHRRLNVLSQHLQDVPLDPLLEDFDFAQLASLEASQLGPTQS